MIRTDPAEQTDRVNTHAIRRGYIVIKSVSNHHRVLWDTVRLFQCPLEDSRIWLADLEKELFECAVLSAELENRMERIQKMADCYLDDSGKEKNT